MINRIWLRCLWVLLVAGALLISFLGNVLFTSPPANRWLHFLVYAAVTSIPCAIWRTKGAIVFSLAIVACSVMSGAAVAMWNWHGVRAESTVSDFFGITAGVLLGLNLRLSWNASGKSAAADARQKSRTFAAIP
jgi:hypothetical protein